jgi:cobalt-zinc-cadmium efflux system protein
VGHGHAHHHDHDVVHADRRLLAIALAITVSIVVAQVAAGLVANSLALLSDAAHNLTDAASIGLALIAARLASRPATAAYTFGLRRAEIMSAQVNGAALVVLGLVIAIDAIARLTDPPDVEAGYVIALGTVGAAGNAAAGWVLSRSQRRSLNVEGAMRHILTDLYASLAAVLAGIAVLAFDFHRADPIAALAVVVIMLWSGWGLLRDSGRVLLEGTPAGMDTLEVGRAMAAVGCVREVHDLHIWELTSGFTALAAHVLVRPGDNCHATRRDLERMLVERFGISHTTLQVDHEAADELLSIDPPV